MKLEKLKTRLLKLDVPPKGFKTRQEWQATWNLCKSACTDLLLRARREGMCEMKKFRVRPGNPVQHYRFKS